MKGAPVVARISNRPVIFRNWTISMVGIMTFSRVQDVKIPDKDPLRTLRTTFFNVLVPAPVNSGFDDVISDLLTGIRQKLRWKKILVHREPRLSLDSGFGVFFFNE
jgi:hypothetical protein